MEERSGPHYNENYIPVHQVPSVKSEQPYIDKNDMEQQLHFHRDPAANHQEWMAKYYAKEATMHPFHMECPPREENNCGEGSPKLEIDYLEDSLNPQLPDFIPQSLNHNKDDDVSTENQVPREKMKGSPDEKKAAPSKPFLCSKCEYKTNFKSNLKSHELNHSGTYKFQCSKCEYKTNFKSNLKNHELNHSLTYKFQCADCEYKTNFKSNLKNHELSHSMTYRFQCEKCEYKTNFKNCMKNHELTHSGTKQFHCSQCEYKTNFKRCLKIHELRHANT